MPEMLEADADPDMRFLFDKQLQEADLVCFTKSDLYPDYPEIGRPHARQLSAKSGQGVAAWLNEVLSGASPAPISHWRSTIRNMREQKRRSPG